MSQTGKFVEIKGERIILGNTPEKARKKTSNKWFETQDSISYWDLFFQPKICWKAVGRNLTFAIVDSGIFLTAPASFISAGGSNKYLLAFLCSAIGKYYIYKNSDTTGAGDIMLNIQSLIRFPIPKIKISDMRLIENMIDQISEKYDPMLQSTIDSKIFSLYGFDKDEIKVINDV